MERERRPAGAWIGWALLGACLLASSGCKASLSPRWEEGPWEDELVVHADRPFLGIAARQLGDTSDGVRIERVLKSSPAEAAGLRPGDVLVRVGATRVHGLSELSAVLDREGNDAGWMQRVAGWRGAKGGDTYTALLNYYNQSAPRLDFELTLLRHRPGAAEAEEVVVPIALCVTEDYRKRTQSLLQTAAKAHQGGFWIPFVIDTTFQAIPPDEWLQYRGRRVTEPVEVYNELDLIPALLVSLFRWESTPVDDQRRITIGHWPAQVTWRGDGSEYVRSILDEGEVALALYSLVLLLGLAGAPLLAQEPAGRESPGEARLRVENEALRRELEATRDRLEALEALVRERLGPAGEAWTAPGQRPPGTPPGPLLQAARLSGDQSTLLVPELRLPEDAGAAGPAELVDALIEGCRALPLDLPEGPLTGLASRLGAFEPTPRGAFLVPPGAWAPLATGSAAAYPQRRQLEGELRELAPCLSGARLSSVTVPPGAPPAAPRLEARLDCPNGPILLHLTAASVNGRLLLVRVRVPWFEANARAALGGMARLLSGRTRHGEPLELPSRAELERVGARVLARPDPFTLRLPGYQVRFQRLAQGEWGAEAEPLLDGAPRLEVGPLPGHDPRRAPYQVREAPCGPR